MNVSRIDFADYLKLPGWNWTLLKHGRESMMQLDYYKKNPPADKKTFGIGRAVHTAVFEPDDFPLKYAVYTGPTTGKGSRTALNEWKRANKGRTILTRAEYDRCLRIRDQVRKDPLVKPILLEGVPEHSIEWIDEESGLKLKARLDWWTNPIVADLKTSQSVNMDRFGHLAHKYGYHCQMAMQQKGIEAVSGESHQPYLIVVQSAPPHEVVLVPVLENELWAGWEEVKKILVQVAHCTETGTWPGRYSDPVPLELPKYSYPDDEEGMTAEVVEEQADA